MGATTSAATDSVEKAVKDTESLVAPSREVPVGRGTSVALGTEDKAVENPISDSIAELEGLLRTVAAVVAGGIGRVSSPLSAEDRLAPREVFAVNESVVKAVVFAQVDKDATELNDINTCQ